VPAGTCSDPTTRAEGKALKGGWLLLIALVVTSGVRADVCVPVQSYAPALALGTSPLSAPVQPPLDGTLNAGSPQGAAESLVGELGLDWRICDDQGRPALPAGTMIPCQESATDTTSAVLDLPALPSSASLFLSAALSLGAFHLARSSRHLQLGALPQWYHDQCPAQIGHAVAFDMEFAPLAVCAFTGPTGKRPAVTCRIPREQRSRFDSQSFLLVESPRGPPAVACQP
jgi:hypothetical protein